MKRHLLLLALISCASTTSYGQRIVFDQKHFQTVNENGAVRYSAEMAHNQYLEKIDNNLQTININTGSVVLAQSIIYNGLANVNSALKNGLAVKDMVLLVADIVQYSRQMVDMAKSEPHLLLFAEDIGMQMKMRSTRLVNDVSGFILNQNVLTDYNSRDQLLRKVTQELQIICGLVYGAWKAMFWAKQRGVFRSINPYADYINTDRQVVQDIIRNSKYLK